MKAKASLSVALAAALVVSSISVTPARAAGGATTLAIIAAVVTIASIKCVSEGADKGKVETLCWLTPFGWLGTANAGEKSKKKGAVYVRSNKKT